MPQSLLAAPEALPFRSKRESSIAPKGLAQKPPPLVGAVYSGCEGSSAFGILLFMDQVVDVLEEYGTESDAVFVFPSEVAADFWRRKILLKGESRSVRMDRIVSWDVFKEKAFPGREERRPVNSSYRTIFLQDFLRRNSRTPFLASLIPEEFASFSGGFLSTLKGLLPNLKALTERMAEDSAFPASGLARDYSLLWEEYRTFLDDYGLYEPKNEGFRTPEIACRAVVFFPEVVADMEELRQLLEASGRVRFVSASPAELPEFDIYPNSFLEIRALVLALGALLDGGTPAEDIVVTFPAIDSYRELLAEQGKLQGVPLRIREGRPPAELPGGILFSRLRAAYASGYHTEDLKAFLLDPSYPWKRPELCRLLVRIGTLRCCLGSAGKEHLWNRALRDLPGDLRPGREFFRELEGAVRGLIEAKNFRGLQAKANGFASRFFDLDAWHPEVLREYQFCLDALSRLVLLQETSGVPVEDPFALWLLTLEEGIYVPRQAEEGIDVYAYRVSAGIRPVRHFIVNAGQEETRVIRAPFGFLRDDLKERLSLKDRDLSEDFLSLYAVSGEKVRWSCSRESRAGITLPPGVFSAAGKTKEASSPSRDRASDAVERERRYWAGFETGPAGSAGSFPYARRGFERFRSTGSVPKGGDFTKTTAAASAETFAELLRKEGKFVVSSTSLETYNTCPFRFFLTYVLGLRDAEFAPLLEDPRFSGVKHHEVLGLLYKRIRTEDGRFRASRLSEYKAWTKTFADDALRGSEAEPGLPLPLVLDALGSMIPENISAFLEREADRYDGYEVAGVEETLTAPLDSAAELKGRLDRISKNPATGKHLLVDYKTGSAVTKKRLLGTAKNKASSFQIPFYVRLASLAGYPAEEAVYYSVKDEKFVMVLGGEKAMFDEESFKDLDALLDKALKLLIEGIARGDYRANPKDCSFCGFRYVCRVKYSVR